jgi:hypothetical protein
VSKYEEREGDSIYEEEKARVHRTHFINSGWVIETAGAADGSG